jgi:prolyl 4-hydroxylase
MPPPSFSPRFDRGCRLADGRDGPPDLAAARAEFAAAEAEGDPRAAHLLAGFLAGGIGGAMDWTGAVEILRSWSPRDPLAARQLELISAMALTPEGDPVQVPASRRVHAEKPIEMVAGLLDAAECTFLIEIFRPRMREAEVVDKSGRTVRKAAARDADYGWFSHIEEPPFVRAINRRIAAATGTDVRQGEPLQVIRYRPGQQYLPHVDGVGGGDNKRVMTAIVYLNDDFTGGDTAFTLLKLGVRAGRGNMLSFRNHLDSGEIDREMRHAGLPVTQGVKYIASRWIRERPPFDEQGNLIGDTLQS